MSSIGSCVGLLFLGLGWALGGCHRQLVVLNDSCEALDAFEFCLEFLIVNGHPEKASGTGSELEAEGSLFY